MDPEVDDGVHSRNERVLWGKVEEGASHGGGIDEARHCLVQADFLLFKKGKVCLPVNENLLFDLFMIADDCNAMKRIVQVGSGVHCGRMEGRRRGGAKYGWLLYCAYELFGFWRRVLVVKKVDILVARGDWAGRERVRY